MVPTILIETTSFQKYSMMAYLKNYIYFVIFYLLVPMGIVIGIIYNIKNIYKKYHQGID